MFYNDLTHLVSITIDIVVGGALMTSQKKRQYKLLKNMTSNNYQWLNKRGRP